MKHVWLLLCLSVSLLGQAGPKPPSKPAGENTSISPVYTADGQLVFPAKYREWIYLTSGVDMSYSPDPMMMGHSMFDNVFVNPEAYRAFLETGTWPDKTMLVLEFRKAGTKASINKAGHYQTDELMGREIHVKDEANLPGKWAFFGFDDNTTAKATPHEAACYACHEQHAAVDTTFVQFYPTLLEIAKKKNTLSTAYVKDEAGGGEEGKKGSKK